MTHTIEKLSVRADGVAVGPVYAARTLPGEIVRGTLDGQQLSQIKIVEPSGDRIKPPCPAYNACGGCALQHASDDFVSGWKVEVVRHAFAAQGIEAEIAGIETSPPQSRRRAKLAGKRTKSGATVGFHGRAAHVVTDASSCHVLLPEIAALIPALEGLTANIGSRKGEVGYYVTACDNGLELCIEGVKPLDPTELAALAGWARDVGVIRTVYDNEVIAEETAPSVQFGTVPAFPPPAAFLQATAHGQAALLRRVLKITDGAAQIADLFGGVGTFALPLATRAEVVLYESDAAAVAAADLSWRRAPDMHGFRAVKRDLFRNPLDPKDLQKLDAVVIDPPRAGADAQMRALAESDVPVIAAVSCNPATFARDAAILRAGGYRMGALHLVDQFRWAAHVECIVDFRRD